MDRFPSLFQENLFSHSHLSAFTSFTCFSLVPALCLAALVTPVRARAGSAGGLPLLPQAPARAGRHPRWHPATRGSVARGGSTGAVVTARPSVVAEASGEPCSAWFLPKPRQLSFSCSGSQLQALLPSPAPLSSGTTWGSCIL